MRDCGILLTTQPTLEGTTGNLNWSADIIMTNWDGVTVERADNLQLVNLLLTDKDLGGTIPRPRLLPPPQPPDSAGSLRMAERPNHRIPDLWDPTHRQQKAGAVFSGHCPDALLRWIRD